MKLDRIDLEILKILQKDSRASHSLISKEIGVSAPTVKSRIDALEKNGIIKRFSIVLNRDAFQKNMIVYLLFDAPSDKIERLALDDSILELHLISGKGAIAKAIFPSLSLFTEFLGKLDVQNLEIFPVVEIKKEEHETEIGPETGMRIACAYCGNEIQNEWYKMKKQNKTLYFCCPVCLRRYRKDKKEGDSPTPPRS